LPTSSLFVVVSTLPCRLLPEHTTVDRRLHRAIATLVGPRRNPLALRLRGRVGERDVALAVR
jgi:hypothetical protein